MKKKKVASSRNGKPSKAAGKRSKVRYGETKKIKWLSQDEVGRLMNAVVAHLPKKANNTNRPMYDKYLHARNVALFELTYRVGLRASEVGNLTCEDYKVDQHELYIKSLKDSRSQSLYLATPIRKLLNKWMKVRGKFHPLDPLFPSARGGKGITRFGLNYLMKNYCMLASVPSYKAHFHVLRHTCAIHAAEGGVDVKDLQWLLRHRDIKSTLVYFNYTTTQKEALSRKLEQMKTFVNVHK